MPLFVLTHPLNDSDSDSDEPPSPLVSPSSPNATLPDLLSPSLAFDPSPFTHLTPLAPASPSLSFRVHFDSRGLPVSEPLPFSPPPSPNIAPHLSSLPSAQSVLSAVITPSPLIADSGCTGILVQLANFPLLSPFFSPKPLPLVPFTLPDGSTLEVGGPHHITGTLTFPHKALPVSCYFLPASALSHSLFGVSPLIRPHGHALFTNTSVVFFDSPSSVTPFLTGSKTAGSDLWHITVPPTNPLPISPPSALFTLQALPRARFVAYWHRAFGSPSLSTFIRALSRGFIRNIPDLTPSLVRKFPPLSLSTSFGHLNTLRRGIASTRPKLSPAAVALVLPSSQSSVSPSASPVSRASARLASSIPAGATNAFTVYRDQWTAADLTGRFPIPSYNGYE